MTLGTVRKNRSGEGDGRVIKELDKNSRNDPYEIHMR